MADHVVLLSIPGLREQDLAHMPALTRLMAGGDRRTLIPTFPCVTWPVQANLLTGKRAADHGVVANGFYWRDEQRVEMWTAANNRIMAPQIWDLLRRNRRDLTSAAWFPMLSKGCGADYVCMPAPVHHPDGSESPWCYTKPADLYGTLRDELGHFPLQHFWGPLAGIPATNWILQSAVLTARWYRPNFLYVYLPHLDYAAQRSGPDSQAARRAVGELDVAIGGLADELPAALGRSGVLYLAASEYVITPVDHVTYPNRVLRAAGLLQVRQEEDGEHLDLAGSQAWALVDHQFAHVFVRDADAKTISHAAHLLSEQDGIAEVLAGGEREKYDMIHPRCGELLLISNRHSWFAYYWWLDDTRAPRFARTVDIHRKPGYDPVELHFDRATRGIPLDASLIKGSHGAPATSNDQRGVFLASQPDLLSQELLADTDVAGIVLRQFGI